MRSVTVHEAYSGRGNSFGLLRLVFAALVLLAHSAWLGFAHPFTTRVDMPAVAVAGFFAISGFLVTRSGRRVSLGRFLWHRALRIWPGLWVCLIVTALVLAPIMYWADHSSLDGFFLRSDGPLHFIAQNWWGGLRQFGVSGATLNTPYGQLIHGDAINGSLWTLAYEISCYLVVAAAAVVGILRRARWLVLAGAVLWFALLCWNHFDFLRMGHAVKLQHTWIELPLLGSLSTQWILWYGFIFLVGGLADLYADKVVLHDGIAAVAAVLVAVSVLNGGILGPGLLAFAYLILWLGVRLPASFQRVGQRNDYSYGLYIYAFPVQQTLARFGVPELGFLAYTALCAAVAFGLAYLSWHLVEKQALRFKGARLPRRRRRDSELTEPNSPDPQPELAPSQP